METNKSKRTNSSLGRGGDDAPPCDRDHQILAHDTSTEDEYELPLMDDDKAEKVYDEEEYQHYFVSQDSPPDSPKEAAPTGGILVEGVRARDDLFEPVSYTRQLVMPGVQRRDPITDPTAFSHSVVVPVAVTGGKQSNTTRGAHFPDDLRAIGGRLCAPSTPDLDTPDGRNQKLLQVADAAGCSLIGWLICNGHAAMSPAAIKQILETRGETLAFEVGDLYRYDGERGHYEIANERIERDILELCAELDEELRRMGLAMSVWPVESVKKLRMALPKAKHGHVTVRDCRTGLYPRWKAPGRMNGDYWTINLHNGLFDLRTQTLRPHTAEHMSSLQLPFDFDPAARCPAWDGYLADALPDTVARDAVQEFVGYCLIPSTKFEVALFLIGSGGTGKSTFVGIMRLLVGEGNCSAIALEDLDQKFRAGSLRGKLVNISTEIDPNKPLNDARFKAYVSGDPVTGEQKFKDPTVFKPFVRFIVAANAFPLVRDRTDAFFRRALVIPFEQKFVMNPNPAADPPERAMDPDLAAKLETEMSGILNWALAGLSRLLARGRFEIHPSLQAHVEAFREDQDNVIRFLREACLVGVRFQVNAKDAYRGYTEWCKAQGEKPQANNVFGRTVANHKGIQAKKSGNRGRYYLGFQLGGGDSLAGDGSGSMPNFEGNAESLSPGQSSA